jgi:hypothetical protein
LNGDTRYPRGAVDPDDAAIDPEHALQLFASEAPEPPPVERCAATVASMPAASGHRSYEPERRASAIRGQRVSGGAWTLSVVFALGWLTALGTIRMFWPSAVEVRQALSPAAPVDVARNISTGVPTVRTQPTAVAKPASVAPQARTVAREANLQREPPRTSELRPANRSSVARPLGNRVVARPVEIERDVPGDSDLSASLARPDEETGLAEPSNETMPAGRDPLASETRAAEPAAPVAPTAAIESVLKNYAYAFSARDVGAAKSVWPGVDERALGRAFEGLQEQHFDLGSCEISVDGRTAVAMCVGTARYRPKVGIRSMRSERRAWTFQLGHRGEAWTIDDVEVR